MALSRITFILFAVFLWGCGSTPNTEKDNLSKIAETGLSIGDVSVNPDIRNSAVGKVRQFQLADFSSVVQPYLEALLVIDQYNEEQICAAESIAYYDELIALNPSSIYVKHLRLECLKYEISDEAYYQELSEITDIAEIILSQGSGESIDSAIHIRELSEVYNIFDLAGLSILDSEVEFHNDLMYYKLHTLDTQTNRFSYKYASNGKFFTNVFSGASSIKLSELQTAKLLFAALVEARASTVVPFTYRTLAMEGKYQEIIDSQTEIELTPLSQILIAQSALMLEQDEILDTHLDDILLYAEQGMVEATSFIAHFLFVKDAEQSWPDIKAELQKIDDLAGKGLGMTLFLESLTFRSDFESQLEKLLQVSSGEYTAEIWSFEDYLQNKHDTSPFDYNPHINSLVTALANSNTPEAQLYLAKQLFEQADATEAELSEARKLLMAAAQAGYDEAQLSLGIKYGTGKDGFKVNRAKAFELYQLAAEQNNKYALHNVAAYYREGIIGDIDLDKAIHYFEKAIEAGYLNGHCLIGEIYRTEMTPPDFISAEKQFNLGISKLEPDQLKSCYEGQGMIEKYVNKNLGKAEVLFQSATDLDSGFAAYHMALMYDFPEYKMQDIDKAIQYYDKAIALEYYDAASNIGYIYEAGKGHVEPDNEKALSYYQLGAEARHPQSMNNLATFYLHGIEIEKDADKAIVLYKQAADRGNDFAADNYAEMLWKGEHLNANYIESCNYFEQAYELQFLDSYFDIAYCYSSGVGRHIDVEKALKILDEGFKMGEQSLIYESGLVLLEHGRYAEAETHLKQAIELGFNDAYEELAAVYLQQERYEEAFSTYQKALESGLEVEAELAKLQWQGRGTVQNKPAAIATLTDIAHKNSKNPNSYLGDKFYFGFFGEPLYQQAFEYYSKIEDPDGRVLNIFGEMFRLGEHVEVDLAKAADFYERAMAKGHVHAFFNLGEMYRDGVYFDKDVHKSGDLFLEGAHMGLHYAMIALSKLYMDGSLPEPTDKNAEYWLRKAILDSDEAWLLLTELLLSKSDADALREGKYWLTIAWQSKMDGADALMQKLGITEEDLNND